MERYGMGKGERKERRWRGRERRERKRLGVTGKMDRME